MNDKSEKAISVISDEDVSYTYVTIGAPRFQSRVEVDGVDVKIKFEDGSLTLHGRVAEVFDAEFHKPGNSLCLFVRKVDRELGERMVRAHQEQHAERAAKGPFSTNMRQDMLAATLAERAATMAPTTGEAEAKQFTEQFGKIAHGDNMALQELTQVAKKITEPASTPATKSTKFGLKK